MADRQLQGVVGGDAEGAEQLGSGEGQGRLAGGVGHDRRQQMGAGAAVGKVFAGLADQLPAQDVAHPVGALEDAVEQLVVATQR
jgi:hypothetical protein